MVLRSEGKLSPFVYTFFRSDRTNNRSILSQTDYAGLVAICLPSGINRGANMSVKQTKSHIKQLKGEMREVNRANDLRLLKLFVLMILLAAIAAMIHGRINFFLM